VQARSYRALCKISACGHHSPQPHYRQTTGRGHQPRKYDPLFVLVVDGDSDHHSLLLALEFKSFHLHSFEIVRLDSVGVFPVICASYEDKTRWLRVLTQLVKRKPVTKSESNLELVSKVEEGREKRLGEATRNSFSEDLKTAIEDVSS